MILDRTTEHHDDMNWYLVQCKPNAERIALAHLENQAFTAFMPMQELTRRRAEIFEKRTRPLFPGYIFVCLDPADGQWRKINSTRGVARLVRFGSDPSPVPTGIVESIRARCDAHGVLQEKDTFNIGDQVHITLGPFSGFLAEITDVKPDQRVHLLLDIMGQASTLTINKKAVEKVK
ncbi:MAG: transcriptional activator RfaH [Alphaproteobacteria bacterium]|nr:transcriptional activator RfaH [Alphaproteobacteria bacterium]